MSWFFRLFLLSLLALGAATAHAAAPAPAPAPDHSAYSDLFRDFLLDQGIPGGAFAIVADGRIVAAQGHGVRGLHDPAPVDADTVFRVGSVSKAMAAHLAARLVEDGTVAWDGRVRDFVPDLAFGSAGHADALQLRHLLGHSTGIVGHAYDNLVEEGRPLAQIIPQFRKLQPTCPPGQCFAYQNVLFSVLEPYLERRSGRSYEDLMRTRVFAPLGMLRSSLGMQAFVADANRARPHGQRNGAWQELELKPNYYGIAPAAGVNSSANDLARLLLAHIGERPGIVTPAMLAALREPRLSTPRELRRFGWRDVLTEAHYGLGWRVYRIGDEVLYVHSGWVSGYTAEVSYSARHRIGLVTLFNGESAGFGYLSSRFWTEQLRLRDRAQTSSAR